MYHVVFFFFQYDENAEYELIGKAYIKPCQ